MKRWYSFCEIRKINFSSFNSEPKEHYIFAPEFEQL